MSGTKKLGTADERREAMRRARLWVEMDRLWARIPDAGCLGHCHAACGPIGMSDAERDRIDRVYGVRIRDGETKPGTLECPALNAEGRCGVYLARPTVCRLWGVSETMPCSHGCQPPHGLMNELESLLLMNASLSLGEDHPFLPENYLTLAAYDEEIGPLLSRFLRGDRSHLDELRDKLIALWRANGRGNDQE